MIRAGYDQWVDRISKSAVLSREEVERRIEAKRAKLSGLISKEGAAQIVAAELGVNFDMQKAKISELLSGMRKVTVTAKVIDIYPVRTFKKNGQDNKVATLLIADDTSSVRTVLWDTNHIKLVESGDIKKGSVVEIKEASVRAGELHLGNISDIKPVEGDIANVIVKENFEEKSILNIQPNQSCSLRAVITQIFEPKFFAVCPECSLKLQPEAEKLICPAHNNIIPKYRAVASLVIDDGTENIRAVCFDEAARKLFDIEDSEKLKDSELFLRKREELLGKELLFSGRARQNKMFGNIEFTVSGLNEINLQELIQKLSK